MSKFDATIYLTIDADSYTAARGEMNKAIGTLNEELFLQAYGGDVEETHEYDPEPEDCGCGLDHDDEDFDDGLPF